MDAAIPAFSENAEELGKVRSILLGLMHEDGTYQLLGSRGNVSTAEMRTALHGRLAPDVVPSQVRYASDSGAPTACRLPVPARRRVRFRGAKCFAVRCGPR